MEVRPRVDALAKIRGEAVYAADVALPGMLHAALVHSPLPSARIVSVDASAALAMPGVAAVLTGPELGERLYGRRVRDVPVLAAGAVRYVGDRVAAVVAENRQQAELAAAAVRVEYEELPAVLDAGAALRPGAPLVHEAAWRYSGAVVAEGRPNLQSEVRRGSAEAAAAAIERADHAVDRTYEVASGHQGYLEPHACVASVDPGGRVGLWVTNKSPYRLRTQVAECLGLEEAAIEIHPVAIGGDFGGKGSPMDAPLCVELARRTGRPVRLVLRYDEELTAANPRHTARIRVRLGCDGDGRLLGLLADVLLDGGAYAGFKPTPSVSIHGFGEIGSSYRVPAAAVEVRIAYTNTVPRGHMRAPGSPEAVFAFESALDELAGVAGVDPVEIRRRNLLGSGEANPWGGTWLESRGRETLEAALAAYRARPAPAGWRAGRGVALYDRATAQGRTSLRLRSLPDGGLLAEVPMPEQGTGGHTVVREGLERQLGLEAGSVTVRQVSTAELPHDDGVGGSRVTAALSHAVAKAAEAWRRRSGDEPVTVLVEPPTGARVTSSCVQIAQVAVDPESGEFRVLEVLTAVDVAAVVNPRAHRLQLEGGVLMGQGLACLEDLQLAEGRVWAATMGEFRIPTARDAPHLRTLLVEGGRGVGALNVKSVGELSNVPVAAAIANALAACGARVRALPLTAERVLAALDPLPSPLEGEGQGGGDG